MKQRRKREVTEDIEIVGERGSLVLLTKVGRGWPSAASYGRTRGRLSSMKAEKERVRESGQDVQRQKENKRVEKEIERELRSSSETK